MLGADGRFAACRRLSTWTAELTRLYSDAVPILMQRASTTALQLSRKWNHTQAQRLLPRTTASAICAQAQAQHATTPRPPIANARRVLVSAWDPREVVPWYLEEMDTDQQNLDERQLKVRTT